MKQYFLNILIAIDQLANTILGGDPDETISSRSGKAITRCRPCKILCKVLNKFDPNHCIDSIEKGEGSRELWHW